MEHIVFPFVYIALVTGCISMAIVFLLLPLPQNKALQKYKISLKFLAGAYLIMALIQFFIIAFNLADINLISIEELAVASLQAPLLAFALIALIHPVSISKRLLYINLIPILILIILYFSFNSIWHDPVIRNYTELKSLALHPTVIIRELFVIFYICQIIYLLNLFQKQIKHYEAEIDNFFSDKQHLHASWIKYLFYVTYSLGIFTLISFFNYSSLVFTIFTISYFLFYMIFGLLYIQYPRTFIFIEKAIFNTDEETKESPKNTKKIIWSELRNQIIAGKYYLKTGISIEEMAQYLKIGRTTLSGFINNEEKMNFNMWINSLRIEEAKQLLLKNPDYNLIQIAEIVGYSELSNFSRQFKSVTSESPSVWRQKNQIITSDRSN